MISHVFLYILSLNSIWFGLTEFGVSLKEIISKGFPLNEFSIYLIILIHDLSRIL